ncbi:MAG: hypothetical protein Q9P01_05150 [Anaerolineae bacterium]|nr:hypothetical protein [Anaerolineae bacterium]
MRNKIRLLTLLGVIILVLGMIIPVAGQDEMLSFSADGCDYGGNFSSIVAIDAHTVEVTLCNLDIPFI